jgi:hypothetical protein
MNGRTQGCEPVGGSGYNEEGARRASRRGVRGECMGTKEARPNRLLEAVLHRVCRSVAFVAFHRPGRRSVPVVPQPARGETRRENGTFLSTFSVCPDAEFWLVSGLTLKCVGKLCC